MFLLRLASDNELMLQPVEFIRSKPNRCARETRVPPPSIRRRVAGLILHARYAGIIYRGHAPSQNRLCQQPDHGAGMSTSDRAFYNIPLTKLNLFPAKKRFQNEFVGAVNP
jgi:hypothetical protein